MIVQVIIDRTTSMVIEGTYEFDRADGGTLVAPSGAAFPSSPTAGEWFWRTDEAKLYRRNSDNSGWDVATAAVGQAIKAGVVPAASFAGNPKKATVTFGTAYANTSYAVTLAPVTDGTKTFTPNIESKTAAGFVVNLNSNNLANFLEMGWHTMTLGS